jgi:hypothetical protein
VGYTFSGLGLWNLGTKKGERFHDAKISRFPFYYFLPSVPGRDVETSGKSLIVTLRKNENRKTGHIYLSGYTG